jgi:hypothetical protein
MIDPLISSTTSRGRNYRFQDFEFPEIELAPRKLLYEYWCGQTKRSVRSMMVPIGRFSFLKIDQPEQVCPREELPLKALAFPMRPCMHGVLFLLVSKPLSSPNAATQAGAYEPVMFH